MGDTSVNAQEFPVNEAGEWQVVEELHDSVIDVLVVLDETLLSEVEVRSQLPAFVVSSQHYEFLGPCNFHRQKQNQTFDREGASIYVVS